MAVLKQRLHRKNANGSYDTIHLETSASLVLMDDGTTTLSSKISSMDDSIGNAVKKTGDTLTGKIYTTAIHNGSMGAASDDGAFRLDGGTDSNKGAFLTLYGKDASGNGGFQLVAVDGTNRKEIKGQANGTLTWDDKPIYHFLGNNVISSTADDTADNWCSLGTGVSYYSISGQLIDQPSQFGLLLSIVTPNTSDVFQIWNVQDIGPTYFRSGNGSGWSDTWRKVYDSTIITAGTTDLTAGSSPLADGNIYFVYE